MKGSATSSEHTPVADIAALHPNFLVINGMREIDAISLMMFVNMANVASCCAACSPICGVFMSSINTDDSE